MSDSLRDQLAGSLTALLTPINRDGEVRPQLLDAQVDYLLEAGVPAAVVGGSIGEGPALSVDERTKLAERFVLRAGTRCVTIVGVTHDAPAEVHRLAAHAAKIGADALLVSVPPFFRLTPAEQLRFWRDIAQASPLPFIVYNSGHGASGPPSLELLDDVLAFPNVLALKEASPQVDRIAALVERFGGRLPVIAAGEKTLPYAVAAGAAAAMTASACFAPQRIDRVVAAACGGDLARALQEFAPINRFRTHFQADMDAGFPSYLSYTKAACEVIGLPVGCPRPPLAPAAPADPERFESDVRACVA